MEIIRIYSDEREITMSLEGSRVSQVVELKFETLRCQVGEPAPISPMLDMEREFFLMSSLHSRISERLLRIKTKLRAGSSSDKHETERWYRDLPATSTRSIDTTRVFQ